MPDFTRVAPLVITGLPDDGLDESFERLVREVPFGGFLLFRRDFGTLDRLLPLVQRLKELSAPRDPLITMDEEGGLVSQLAPDVPVAPTARVMGRIGDTETIRAIGAYTGDVLRNHGVELDFAPVYDLDTEPANPVIGPRSFSPRHAEVSRMANAFAEGLRDQGVLSCAKHAPGHGETRLDSHLDLPVCRLDRTALFEHLSPFVDARVADVPSFMVSHVAYSEIDEELLPATLSPEVVQGYLRVALGDERVFVTDALEMKAVADRFPPGEAAIRALEAGNDLLLYGTYTSEVAEALDSLVRAAGSGRLPESRLERSRDRIETLRARRETLRGRSHSPVPEPDWGSLARRGLHSLGGGEKPLAVPDRSSPWIVIEPEWKGDPTLASLLRRAGIEVISRPWERLADPVEQGVAGVCLASTRRTPLTASERKAIRALCRALPTYLIAFAQDAFLQDFGEAAVRLSAADPGPAMRRVVAQTLFQPASSRV